MQVTTFAVRGMSPTADQVALYLGRVGHRQVAHDEEVLIVADRSSLLELQVEPTTASIIVCVDLTARLADFPHNTQARIVYHPAEGFPFFEAGGGTVGSSGAANFAAVAAPEFTSAPADDVSAIPGVSSMSGVAAPEEAWVVTVDGDIARVVAELLLPRPVAEIPDAQRPDYLDAVARVRHLHDQLQGAFVDLLSHTCEFRSIDS